jgi:hypothetical protein
VLAAVHKTKIPNFILGGTFKFDSHGEPSNARFYVYKVINGQYRLIH